MHKSSVARRSSVPNLTLDYPWVKTKEDIATHYKVDEAVGLSEKRVKQDLEKYGPNGI
jgi:hypothetical protein